MKSLIVVLLLLLIGCTSVPTSAPLVVEPTKRVYIDSYLLKPCALLEKPTELLTFESILTVTKTNTYIYIECRNKMDAAIVVLKKFSNLNP
jgi:hypothetical protein